MHDIHTPSQFIRVPLATRWRPVQRQAADEILAQIDSQGPADAIHNAAIEALRLVATSTPAEELIASHARLKTGLVWWGEIFEGAPPAPQDARNVATHHELILRVIENAIQLAIAGENPDKALGKFSVRWLRSAAKVEYRQAVQGEESIQLADSAAKVSLDKRALALFTANRDWTKKRIAKELGCHEKSLSPERCPELSAAMRLYKCREPYHTRGAKGPEGHLEAWR